ncbi:hypothetical protein [Streptomyces sp. OR43]|uniref:hypothetical protein n=1 Tax=Streptomyces sp. or43 TaxID=2478957 RepID=UPI001650DAE2|nr:hypothetical protein [Streptomyces sp. or43]
MPEPSDPMTALAAAAAQVHELYRSYMDAGFTEQQALELTKAVLAAGVRGAA